MPRRGKALEILVKRLQEFLVPQGIKVTSPEEFYFEGKRLGEIDVTLRGEFESGKVFIGIECRDRPSEGPQGRDWIRELRGKQDDFKVGKMIAVSSTGFSEPAIDLANEFEIDLLTFVDLQSIKVEEWFETITWVSEDKWHEIVGAVDITTQPPNIRTPNDPSKLQLIPGEGRTPVTLVEFLTPFIDSAFEGMEDQGPTASKTTMLDIRQPIDARIGRRKFKIVRVRVPLRLNRSLYCARFLLNACARLSDSRVVALTGNAKVQTRNGTFRAVAIVKRSRSDPSARDLRVHFETEKGDPYELPAGSAISLYGLEE